MAREQRKRAVLAVLCVIFFLTALFGIWQILRQQKEYDVGVQTYEALAQQAFVQPSGETELVPPVQEERPAESQSVEAPPTQPQAQPDFTYLQSLNPQVMGWLTGCGGAINYPVVHGTDNDYYLSHLVDGTYNSNGSIFVDFRSSGDLTDRNTFIYGHNMKNGTMFGPLVNYAQQSYYDQNPTLTLITADGAYSLEPFSGYVTPGTSDTYILEFADDEAFAAYLTMVRDRSDFISDVQVKAEDTIVTLSTCTYDYDDARFVLHCKLSPIQ